MMIRKVITFICLCLIGGMSFMSCNGEAVPTHENPNASDSTGANLRLDLFISGEVNNIPYTIYNGVDGYTNYSVSYEDGFCPGANNKFVQVHTTSFSNPTDVRNSFHVDIRGCVNVDSAQAQNKIDSVLVVGEYEYFPRNDTGLSVTVRYIDADSVVWSTAFGRNLSSFSRFELSAVIDNDFDEHAEKVAFGKFEGYVYNGMGDSLRIKLGQFKGRIVR